MSGSLASAPLTAAADVLGVPFWAWQVAFSVVGVAVLIWLARTAWNPGPAALRWWMLANIAVNAGIAVTGATVRVTQSGLGCSEWPRCTPDSFVPSGGEHHPVLNEAIEFGNRTLTFLVLAVGLIVLVALWRAHGRRRPDLLLLGALIPAGVLGQAVVGGITVWTQLHPAAVGTHFLLSMVVLVAGVCLYLRGREPRGALHPTVPTTLRRLASALAVLAFVLLAAGVVTTGTGPLGGDLDAPRWALDLPSVTRVHSTLGWATALLALTLLAGLLRAGAPRRLRGYAGLLLAVLLAQGAVGYTQYALALPEWLVVSHVLGSVVSWVLVLRVYFGTAERLSPEEGSRPAADSSAAGAPAR
jgi:heme a synthase